MDHRPPRPARAMPAMDRRQLLARLGTVATAAGLAPVLLRGGAAGAAVRPSSTVLHQALATEAAAQTWPVTTDTFNGVAAFVAPGDDPYSVHQGVAVPEPGGLAARAGEFDVVTLNEFFPIPEIAATLIEALEAELHAVPLPGGLDAFTWLDGLLEHDGTLPLAPVIAGLLDLLAVQVEPSSVAGPFLTPFPRLSWQEKGEVWRRFEQTLPDLLTPGAPGSILPPLAALVPRIGTLPGILRFAAGAVLEITAFGAYNEWHVFDPATRMVTGTPVGWELAEYAGPVDGWDELIGYYQGRTTADA